MKNILLIGCGHMGMSLMESWINSKSYSISIVDPIKYNYFKNKSKYKKIDIFKNLKQNINFNQFNLVIFAIRPKDLNSVIEDLKNIKFNKNSIIISVIAGKKLQYFKKNLKSVNKFVRVMPNMPALIGQGMNCIFTNKNLNKSDIIEVEKLFKLTGKTLFFQSEKNIDMATAVSGSGPGFVFNLIDAMEKASVKLGFNKKDAKLLVAQTFKGSIELLAKSELDSESLVSTVSTKGGTTEAGLNVMKKHKIHDIFIKLIKTSYNRAKQQGK